MYCLWHVLLCYSQFPFHHNRSLRTIYTRQNKQNSCDLMDRLLALLLVAQWINAAAAVSPHDARREFLMMLDPLAPAKLARPLRSNIQLEQQQHLKQQVERYATAPQKQHKRKRRSSSKGQHRGFERYQGQGLARSLRDTSSGPGSKAAPSSRQYGVSLDLPPASCYHVEQQDVQLVVAFDCSQPGVQGQVPEDVASRACAAALAQMQQLAPSSSSTDYSYEETNTSCQVMTPCGAAYSSDSLQLQLDISLPYDTCAVTVQILAEQLADNPHTLFRTESDLAAAVLSIDHIPTPDSRAASISASIQRSKNEILRAVSIAAADAEDFGVFGGMVDEDTGAAPDWMWDPYLSYNPDLATGMSVWVAAVCTFGVGFVLLSVLLLHRGVLILAARWEEYRLVRQAQADAAEAAAEAAAAAEAEDGGSRRSSASSDSELGGGGERERSTAGLLPGPSMPGREEAVLLPAVAL